MSENEQKAVEVLHSMYEDAESLPFTASIYAHIIGFSDCLRLMAKDSTVQSFAETTSELCMKKMAKRTLELLAKKGSKKDE